MNFTCLKEISLFSKVSFPNDMNTWCLLIFPLLFIGLWLADDVRFSKASLTPWVLKCKSNKQKLKSQQVQRISKFDNLNSTYTQAQQGNDPMALFCFGEGFCWYVLGTLVPSEKRFTAHQSVLNNPPFLWWNISIIIEMSFTSMTITPFTQRFRKMCKLDDVALAACMKEWCWTNVPESAIDSSICKT